MAAPRPGASTTRRLSYLMVKTGPQTGQSTQLTQNVDIGRDGAINQLVITDPHVSASHGRVRLEDGSYVFHDLASSGGSWHIQTNGERRRITEPLRLMHGDVIEIGKTRIVFMESSR
jgi:pSer/pThr/pTyr-binding forkhead associated (FHA) protein